MKCDELQRYEVRADYDAGTIAVPCDNDKYGKYMIADDVIGAIAEIKNEIKRKDGVCHRWFARCMEARAENKRLKRALWLARAERAKEHVWHDVKQDGSPKEDYKGRDWVLVQLREIGSFELIPRIAEYRQGLKRWAFIDEEYDTENSHEFRYLRYKCVVIGWRDIDFAYYGKKFFVQQEINKNVERKCRAKAEEYK